MKKGLLALALSIAFFSMAFIPPPEPNYKVEMTQNEWEAVLSIIDNAAVPGDVRKPLMRKIQEQVVGQIKALADSTRKAAADSTKKQPKKP